MDIREFFEQIRNIDKEISSNIDLIERLRAKELSCTSVLSDEPRNDTVSDKSKIIDKRIDLERKIEKYSIRLYDLIDEAKVMISKLPDTTKRAIMTEYYLNNKSWEEVAVVLNYSCKQVKRINKRSLEYLEKMSPNVLECPILTLI